MPADIARRGLVRSFQISAVFPHLSCLENVRVALQKRLRGDSFEFWRSEELLGRLDGGAYRLLEAVRLEKYRDSRPSTALRPQAGAGDSNDPGAGTGTDAAGRTDGRHGP